MLWFLFEFTYGDSCKETKVLWVQWSEGDWDEAVQPSGPLTHRGVLKLLLRHTRGPPHWPVPGKAPEFLNGTDIIRYTFSMPEVNPRDTAARSIYYTAGRYALSLNRIVSPLTTAERREVGHRDVTLVQVVPGEERLKFARGGISSGRLTAATVSMLLAWTRISDAGALRIPST